MAPVDLSITRQDNSMSLERHYNFQGQDYNATDKYTLDGKECVNQGWQGSQKKSTVAWSENSKALVIKSKVPLHGGGRDDVVGDLVFGLFVRKVEESLQDQNLEHQHHVVRFTARGRIRAPRKYCQVDVN